MGYHWFSSSKSKSNSGQWQHFTDEFQRGSFANVASKLNKELATDGPDATLTLEALTCLMNQAPTISPDAGRVDRIVKLTLRDALPPFLNLRSENTTINYDISSCSLRLLSRLPSSAVSSLIASDAVMLTPIVKVVEEALEAVKEEEGRDEFACKVRRSGPRNDELRRRVSDMATGSADTTIRDVSVFNSETVFDGTNN